jgi:hypothetical protein
VLKYSPRKIAGHPDLESVAAAGHDVSEIDALIHGRESTSTGCVKGKRRSFAALRMTSSVGGRDFEARVLRCAQDDKVCGWERF